MQRIILILLTNVLLISVLFSCDDSSGDAFKIEIADDCDSKDFSIFEAGKRLNKVEVPPLDEISGMAASINNPGYYWVHTDSEGESAIYLVDSLGKYITKRILYTSNSDWEDIACVKSPYDNKSYVFIADIGDNDDQKSRVRLIQIEEPKIDLLNPKEYDFIEGHKNIMFEHPTGAVDAESLFIDPLNLDIYIITKPEKFSRVMLGKFPYNAETNKLEHIATLPNGGITAGDINSNGDEVLIRNYGEVFYYKRKNGEELKYTFQNKPICLPIIPEPKGEAICFSLDNNSFYTVTEVRGYEKLNNTFNKYLRK